MIAHTNFFKPKLLKKKFWPHKTKRFFMGFSLRKMSANKSWGSETHKTKTENSVVCSQNQDMSKRQSLLAGVRQNPPSVRGRNQTSFLRRKKKKLSSHESLNLTKLMKTYSFQSSKLGKTKICKMMIWYTWRAPWASRTVDETVHRTWRTTRNKQDLKTINQVIPTRWWNTNWWNKGNNRSSMFLEKLG